MLIISHNSGFQFFFLMYHYPYLKFQIGWTPLKMNKTIGVIMKPLRLWEGYSKKSLYLISYLDMAKISLYKTPPFITKTHLIQKDASAISFTFL